ncbi:MAG: biopolymer transporter ExbD [Planctomycetaceae bacterium]|jgi:biopolymer transport protein ExbD|nr:biopolymer transporter ExbD [Planctomycetaceae bacterium]
MPLRKPLRCLDNGSLHDNSIRAVLAGIASCLYKNLSGGTLLRMMIPPECLKPPKGRFNMTPMIDVVFLLIIFFAVSSNLIRQDAAVPVDLPAAKTGTAPNAEKIKMIVVSVPAAGAVYAGSKPVSMLQLRQILKDFRENSGSGAEIRIRTGKKVPYGEIKKILTSAAESGITKVSFSVTEN